MKNRILLTVLLLITLNVSIFGFGKKEEAEIKTQNNEWILCITNFDISALPPEKLHVSSVISRKIVDRLNAISYRARISHEYAYYEEYSWSRARSAAAKAVSAKMDERSAALFRGDPEWKYRQNIKKIDDELINLRAALKEIENNAPPINREPAFKLTSGNLSYTFPAAPAAGAEIRFCTSNNADAFLSGSIIDFYGRYLLSVRLFMAYTRTFIWEDSVIFSQEDIDTAMNEIIQRLIIVLSGNEPAVIEIAAQPRDALVLINRSFAGRGNTDKIELAPATIVVTATAPEYESVTFETVLSTDEITRIDINLNPLNYADVTIAGEEGGMVYQGALFVGTAPLTLRLPVNQLEFFEMKKRSSNTGTIVFKNPSSLDAMPSYSIATKPPLPAGRVDKDRRSYYWAWAATWLTGITAWIAHHSYTDASNVYNPDIASPEFVNNLNTLNYVRTGALVGLGLAGSYGIYRFIRYLISADSGSTPIAVPIKKPAPASAVDFTSASAVDSAADTTSAVDEGK